MRLLFLLFVLSGLVSAVETGGTSALARSQAASVRVPAVRIAFTQTKELAILDQSLVTTGSLEIDRVGARLRWQFDRGATLILAADRLRRWGADGREEDLGHDPSAQAMAGQMRGFLGGNWGSLGELFTIEDAPQVIRCRPRSPAIGRYLEELTIAIDTQGVPTQLVLRAPGGDVTTYQFAEPDLSWKATDQRFSGP